MRFPARLHVLLARDKPYGVVIRRGPAKSVCTIGWDLAKEEFQLGQWLRGRIYEERCDLSPDGKYLIYFALNGRWQSETKGSYTAISRAPFLKAITLYPQGDTWGGGGVFTGPRDYWLPGVCEKPLRESDELKRDQDARPWVGLPAMRLERNGWAPVPGEAALYEKPAPYGWKLRKYLCSGFPHEPGRGCHWEEHALVHDATDRIHRMPAWEWADVDGSRIVWASKGTLNATTLARHGPGPHSQLADFNDMKFEAIQAPY